MLDHAARHIHVGGWGRGCVGTEPGQGKQAQSEAHDRGTRQKSDRGHLAHLLHCSRALLFKLPEAGS